MDDNIAIKVDNLSKTFKLPHEKNTSIKSAFINFYKRKKSFEKQEALKNISFEVKKGEFFAIAGRNGGGKSTLLKMLAGIYTPDEGQVHVRGKLTPFIELGVGFNPELSGRENVFLNGALLGFNRKEMEAMYDDIVEFSEIERFMDQKLKNYSSGMQVRLAFSIAIRARSDILLLDEVLAVGDAAFQQKCFNYFEKLKQQKKTVVFVSHDMGAVKRFCTKAIYIDGGKIIYEGDPADVADLYVKDNLEHEQVPIDKQAVAKNGPKINAAISQQTDTSVTLEVRYDTKNSKESHYVAFSILREGFSIAEITTPTGMKLTGKGKVAYSLDTTAFNAGVYEITLVLCTQKNRKLVSICEDRPKFILKGNDITKGGALKLADSWKRL